MTYTGFSELIYQIRQQNAVLLARKQILFQRLTLDKFAKRQKY